MRMNGSAETRKSPMSEKAMPAIDIATSTNATKIAR